MDALSIILSKSNAGCAINSCNINQPFYADDSVLMAPNAKGLQQQKYAAELTFNTKKTKVMFF